MKFVDEAKIEVQAGKGGHGALSFRREKFVPRGGPDGGDGGDGGDVILVAVGGLNTLIDFRYRRRFKAGTGEGGKGRQRFGKRGEDLEIRVPVGTIASDIESGEAVGELLVDGERLVVARGGRRGLGNVNFKSSTNRAPRRVTLGKPGEQRSLKLELRLLADVGLVGMPNAGKSTLISAVSAARPKVADYPFTTLYPQLGVVSLGADQSFVMADVPGLIEGAADGAGLGVRFLKHLARTRLLLHVVDIAPIDPGHDAVSDVRTVAEELERFSDRLAGEERWLVLNKIDTVPESGRDALVGEVREALGWDGPCYAISAVTGAGCKALCGDVMQYLETRRAEAIMDHGNTQHEPSEAWAGFGDATPQPLSQQAEGGDSQSAPQARAASAAASSSTDADP